MWTQFMDMNSGGRQKLKWPYIYIEAPQAEAERVFQSRFGRNPNRVTCTCCGEDYSTTEAATLAEATAYERGCTYGYVGPDGKEVPEEVAWVRGKGIQPGYKGMYLERANTNRTWANPYQTVDEYRESSGALFITADEIKPEERDGELRTEGYVWCE